MIIMKVKLQTLLIAFAMSTGCNAQYKNESKVITLKNDCFFDKQNRRIIDSLVNKIAVVSKKGSYFIFTIDNKKYLPCNMPDGYVGKKIIMSAYILQEFKTEKVIATPIRIITASIVNG